MNCLWRRFTRPLIHYRALKLEIKANVKRTIVCQHNVNIICYPTSLQQNSVFSSVIRHKSKKAKYDSDDEEEITEDDSSLSKDSKVVKFNTTSLRTDLILKSALGIARKVNGKKIMKKSASVRLGDEIDIVKMVSPKNPDHLYVYRVQIMNVAAKEDAIAITARRFKNLLIENYEEDPFKGSAGNEEQ
ncbi:hypothetical protein NE865_03415 [Phthorimaea operculella]|nr:hypothetical protein NE865_03415 [Phthorimaea operculella]